MASCTVFQTPSSPRGACRQSGFTLIEILVAIAIFVFSMLAIATVQVSVIRHNSDSNLRDVSSALAAGVLDQILAINGSDGIFSEDSGPTDWPLDPKDETKTSLTVPGGGTYTARYSIGIKVPDDVPFSGLAKVTVAVSGQAGQYTVTGFKVTQ